MLRAFIFSFHRLLPMNLRAVMVVQESGIINFLVGIIYAYIFSLDCLLQTRLADAQVLHESRIPS